MKRVRVSRRLLMGIAVTTIITLSGCNTGTDLTDHRHVASEGMWKNNGDGTHTAPCRELDAEITENHKLVWKDKGNVGHVQGCSRCDYESGEVKPHEYTDDADTECDVCNHERVIMDDADGGQQIEVSVTDDVVPIAPIVASETARQNNNDTQNQGLTRLPATNNWTWVPEQTQQSQDEQTVQIPAQQPEQEIQPIPDANGHTEHSWSGTYSYDDDNHWFACTNPNCTERSQQSAHRWEYANVDGTNHKQQCSVCKFKKPDSVQAHNYEYGFGYDSIVHWPKCICGSELHDLEHEMEHDSSGTFLFDDTNHWTICRVCNAPFGTVSHYYDTSEWVYVNGAQHGNPCLGDCGKIGNLENHTFVDGACSKCDGEE